MFITLIFWSIYCLIYAVTLIVMLYVLPEIKQRVEILYFFDEVKVKNETSDFVILFDRWLDLVNIVTGGVEFVYFLWLIFIYNCVNELLGEFGSVGLHFFMI